MDEGEERMVDRRGKRTQNTAICNTMSYNCQCDRAEGWVRVCVSGLNGGRRGAWYGMVSPSLCGRLTMYSLFAAVSVGLEPDSILGVLERLSKVGVNSPLHVDM
jgi:hypothetical protein